MYFPRSLAVLLVVLLSGGVGYFVYAQKGLTIPISAAVGGGTLVVSLIVIRLVWNCLVLSQQPSVNIILHRQM
jgi:protein-S-isoprenylcysteine O-methyltransferase Ste14